METLVYRVVADYGLRDSNPWSGIVPGDVVRLADTVRIAERSFVPAFLVSDTGRRSRFPTFLPLEDLGRVLDVVGAETLASYDARLRLQSARHMLVAAVDEIVQLSGAESAKDALRDELARWTVGTSDGEALDILATYLRETPEWSGGDFCELSAETISRTGRSLEGSESDGS